MLYYDDIFLSIQGESRDTGTPCVFIRLFGCPVGCSYCDTPQSAEKNRHEITEEDLISLVYEKYKGITHVCITGGEPLIQKEVIDLAKRLIYKGFCVSIETSGCVKIEEDYYRLFKYIMDIKCPSSGVIHKNIYSNLEALNAGDDVVCVIKDRGDYEFVKNIIKKFPTKATIMLSPMFNERGEYVIGKDLVNWVLEDRLKCRIQLQMHKILGVM